MTAAPLPVSVTVSEVPRLIVELPPKESVSLLLAAVMLTLMGPVEVIES